MSLTVPVSSTIQIETHDFYFEDASSDQRKYGGQPRKKTEDVNFRRPLRDVVAVIHGYDAKYKQDYGQLKRICFKVDAQVDSHNSENVKVTCEWAFGSDYDGGFVSGGWVGVTVFGFIK